MCLFCDIIEGKIPSYRIYEDEYTYAFLDISDDVVGHTLVVPKNHCTNVLDADDETLGHVMSTVKKISNHYVNDCGYHGVNILNSSGESAEQTVFHLHIHILPRRSDDGLHCYPVLTKKNSDLSALCEKLKMN